MLELSEQVYAEADSYSRLQILYAIGNYKEQASPSLSFLATQVASQEQALKLEAIRTTARVVQAMQERDLVNSQVLSYLERFDKDGDGQLKEDEVNAVKRILGNLTDRDGDQQISRDELAQALAETRDRRSSARRRASSRTQGASSPAVRSRRPRGDRE